jgi:hypothetical protein
MKLNISNIIPAQAGIQSVKRVRQSRIRLLCQIPACAGITIFIIMLSLSAHAQTPVSPKTANSYYASCMDHKDLRMMPGTQENLCSCASVKLMSDMTLEELAVMSPQPGPGRVPYNKMLVHVYGPCLQPAIQDELEDECMQDNRIKQFMIKNQDRLCQCMGQKSVDYLSTKITSMLQDLIKTDPKLTDIYTPLLDNPDLRGHAYGYINSCLHEINQ